MADVTQQVGGGGGSAGGWPAPLPVPARRRGRWPWVLAVVVGLLVLLAGWIVWEVVRSDQQYLRTAWAQANGERDRRGDAALPRFEAHDCPFDNGTPITVDCGTLVVPQSRLPDGGEGTVELAVAILRSTAERPQPDPVVYLEGGPGGAAVSYFDFWAEPPYATLAERDLILVDQRGTGYSSPSLACPEAFEVEEAAGDRALLAAYRSCHDRLVAEGVDLSAFNTVENAADIADLRVALGIDEWNLWGVSYGTRLALRIMDRHPEGVRSVVLDSTYPVEEESLVGEATYAAAAFDALFASCDADRACSSRYGDLEARLAEAVRELDADPAVVTDSVLGPIGRYEYEVDGALLVDTIFGALYDTETLADLPAVIDLAADGEVQQALAMLPEWFVEDPRYATADSDGVFYSTECREEAATIDAAEVEVAAAGLPSALREGLSRSVEHTLAVCAFWDSGAAGPGEREPVVSDIPTLVMAGGYDPITPPAWGERTARTLRDATYVEFPGAGHAVSFAGECPEDLVADFVADPTAAPDTACALEDFAAPAFTTADP